MECRAVNSVGGDFTNICCPEMPEGSFPDPEGVLLSMCAVLCPEPSPGNLSVVSMTHQACEPLQDPKQGLDRRGGPSMVSCCKNPLSLREPESPK